MAKRKLYGDDPIVYNYDSEIANIETSINNLKNTSDKINSLIESIYNITLDAKTGRVVNSKNVYVLSKLIEQITMLESRKIEGFKSIHNIKKDFIDRKLRIEKTEEDDKDDSSGLTDKLMDIISQCVSNSNNDGDINNVISEENAELKKIEVDVSTKLDEQQIHKLEIAKENSPSSNDLEDLKIGSLVVLAADGKVYIIDNQEGIQIVEREEVYAFIEPKNEEETLIALLVSGKFVHVVEGE